MEKRIKVNCAYCNKLLERIPYRIKIYKNSFCNNEHFYLWKRENTRGNRNINYKDGRTLKKYYCKICKKEISIFAGVYGSGLCKSCALHKNKKHYFCECGKEITYNTFFYGEKRCQKCNGKERSKRIKGDNNPNWIDGRKQNPYPSEFNELLRESIRKRDNYECQNCSMTEEEHLIVIGENLHIHHIDYNKKNCKEDNLITLCKQCNLRANSNRTYWQDFYTRKILCLKNYVGASRRSRSQKIKLLKGRPLAYVVRQSLREKGLLGGNLVVEKIAL